jgi:hypothetical protein
VSADLPTPLNRLANAIEVVRDEHVPFESFAIDHVRGDKYDRSVRRKISGMSDLVRRGELGGGPNVAIHPRASRGDNPAGIHADASIIFETGASPGINYIASPLAVEDALVGLAARVTSPKGILNQCYRNINSLKESDEVNGGKHSVIERDDKIEFSDCASMEKRRVILRKRRMQEGFREMQSFQQAHHEVTAPPLARNASGRYDMRKGFPHHGLVKLISVWLEPASTDSPEDGSRCQSPQLAGEFRGYLEVGITSNDTCNIQDAIGNLATFALVRRRNEFSL